MTPAFSLLLATSNRGKLAELSALLASVCCKVADGCKPVADGYLSVKHRDNRANSCLFSSLGTEAARGSADLRHRMTEAVRRRIDHLGAEAKGETAEERRRAAILAWSAMVGAMLLARLVDDERLSKEILKETRAALPLAQ